MLRLYQFTTQAGVPQEEYAHITFINGKFAVVKGKCATKGEVLTTHDALYDAEAAIYALGYTIQIPILQEAI